MDRLCASVKSWGFDLVRDRWDMKPGDSIRAFMAKEARVPRVVLLGGSCVKCDLDTRNLSGARFMGGQFQQASLVGSSLKGASFAGTDFSGAGWRAESAPKT